LTAPSTGIPSSAEEPPITISRHLDKQESIQGSGYTARGFRQACERLGIAQSTGRPGSAPGNAVTGSWHSTLESGLRSLREFAARAQARAAVAAWTGDCSHVRRHSALGMRSPVDYERFLPGKDAA